MNRMGGQGDAITAHATPQMESIGLDSRTVAMEAGIRQGVRNSSPAESVGPENGRCSSRLPIPPHRTCCVPLLVATRSDSVSRRAPRPPA